MTKGELYAGIPRDEFKIVGLSNEVQIWCRKCEHAERPFRTWYWSALKITDDRDKVFGYFADHLLWHDDHPGEDYEKFERARMDRIGMQASHEAMKMLNRLFR